MDGLLSRMTASCIILFTFLSCTGGGGNADMTDSEIEVLRDSVSYYGAEGKRLRNSSRYHDAIRVHTRGLELSEELCDTLEIVRSLNNIGTVYRRMGLLEDAASWHYQALTLCDRWSDRQSTDAVKNRVISLNGIGNVHLSMGNDLVAMDSFREALKGETTLGSATGMAINYANIGALVEKRGDLDSARWYYGQSLQCNVESNNVLGIAICHNHFGRLFEMEEKYDEAGNEYHKAYQILEGGKDKWHWLQACVALSRVSVRRGQYSVAEKYLDEGLRTAEDAGSLAHLADLRHLKYELCRKTGDFARALLWLEAYETVSDSLAAKRNEEKMYSMMAGYEHEKSRSEMEHMRQMHRQENRRRDLMLGTVLVILALSSLGIGILVYALRLRSRNQKMLHELNQTRSNYFTNIAHEFRTPLTVILSAAGSIHENTSEEDSREDSHDILIHSRELLDLVDQVLEVARMTSSIAPDPVWRRADVVGYVSYLCERYERFAKEKGLELVKDFRCGELEMDFLPDRLQRIIGNLLSNALKYSRRGAVVTVRLSRTSDDSGEYLDICVLDEGRGMSSSQIENIFKPFYRAEDGTSGVGTGIGLYVVKLSVDAMGGSVKVRSSLGGGTAFDVRIPVRHDMACETFEYCPSQIQNPLEASSCCTPCVRDDEESPRILIVEDRPEVAKWEMRQLDSRYSFYFAADGEEGLRIAEEIVPDLIITDVMMPVMDGLELCRIVRLSELLCHIPVIMVTAKAGQEDRIAGLEAGADAYLQKPFDENELSLRVKGLLEQRELLKRAYMKAAGSSDDMVQRRNYSVKDQNFLDRFVSALENAFRAGRVDCEELASELCIGRVQLNRKIKAITGLKTTEYIHLLRITRAKDLLDNTALSIGEVALRCGVEDVGYFSTIFRKSVGMTPSAYRNR